MSENFSRGHGFVSVDSRIYRAFFAHTRYEYEMKKNDNSDEGAMSILREATRKWKVLV